MFKLSSHAGALLASLLAVALLPLRAPGAEATTGAIVGTVSTASGSPVANARVAAGAASGRYSSTTDARGRFSLLGVNPDTYTVVVTAAGFQGAGRDGVTVLPGATQTIAFVLAPALHTIAEVRSTARSFAVGSTSDTFTVTGAAARAGAPSESSSGLANYTQGTVQGAIAAVPGVDEDAFANAILRGGKIQDAVFDFDSVPVPQGLIAEPGGNVAGAQLFTTGVGSTTTTLAGFEAEGQNALGGVIDQIPAVGTYPGSTTLEFLTSIGALGQGVSFQTLQATPDLRWRYAVSATAQSEYLPYGDGTTFYPTEGGFGLALQTRGQFSTTANVHYQLKPSDDLSFAALFGEANYDEYDTPFEGETNGFLNGASTVFPNATDQSALVDTPARVRGTYDVLKLAWVHTRAHSLSRVQVFQSQFGSVSGGAWWDDDGFPDGSISLYARQGGREEGLSYDVDDLAGDRHHLKYGVQFTTNTSFLDQVVPTADQYIDSNPTVFTTLAYLGDTWSISRRLDLTGTLRTTFSHIVPNFGYAYDDDFVDPHLSAAYRIGGDFAFRATFDRTSVAPAPLEADRVDSANPAPFVPLAPETANNFTYSFEGGGKTQFRATYYADRELNRIDVLPVNFRDMTSPGENPSGIGVPTNAGELRAHGFEFWLKRAGFSLDTNFIRAYSSSAEQFALNDLNAAAVAAGHLFPVGYVPDFSAILAYEADFDRRRLRVTPQLSYQTGYPYGNGRMVWTFGRNGRPELVPNDNHINPGYNYYFLADPACPHGEVPGGSPGACVPGNNPYIGTLGTNEGDDPNTLRGTPQVLASLHIEQDMNSGLTAILDVANLLGVATPQQYLGNPYLIGPPGYAGGNPAYEAWYARQMCPGPCPPPARYTYGNGVPVNYFPNAMPGENPIRQSLPWTYGRAAYVPLGFPNARTVQLRLRIRM